MKSLYESILDPDFDVDDIVIIPEIQNMLARNAGRPSYDACEHKFDIKVKKDTAVITIATRSKEVDLSLTHEFWDKVLGLLNAKYLTLKLKRKNGTLALASIVGEWENLTLEADHIFMMSPLQHRDYSGKDATQVELKKSTVNARELTLYQTRLKVKNCKLNYDKLTTRNGGSIIEI